MAYLSEARGISSPPGQASSVDQTPEGGRNRTEGRGGEGKGEREKKPPSERSSSGTKGSTTKLKNSYSSLIVLMLKSYFNASKMLVLLEHRWGKSVAGGKEDTYRCSSSSAEETAAAAAAAVAATGNALEPDEGRGRTTPAMKAHSFQRILTSVLTE